MVGWTVVPAVVAAVALGRWQGLLLDAGRAVGPMAAAAERGEAVSPREAGVMLAGAAERLAGAVSVRPAHEPTGKALGRTLAVLATATGDAAVLERSVASARALAVADGGASAWGWLGSTAVGASETGLGSAEQRAEWRAEGLGAFETAAVLDPYGVTPALRLMRAHEGVDAAAAARWAGESLRRDGFTALDPLVGLSDADRRMAERLAGADGG